MSRLQFDLTTQEGKQALFDQAFVGLHSQGFQRSMTEIVYKTAEKAHKTCAYRGENNFRCAIGWIIPDDQYDPKIEGMCAAYVFTAGYFDTGAFLVNLQDAHDRGHTPVEMKELLLRFAKDYSLSIPSV